MSARTTFSVWRNVRAFARPASGTIGLYLDDLFTDPRARRRGVGAALLDASAALAAQRGASLVRWITDGDNATARALYDQHALATTVDHLRHAARRPVLSHSARRLRTAEL